MNTENNRRWQENAAAMENTLLELLEKKKFSKITVQDICTGACVNRSTFYRHYPDMNDLMEKTAWLVMRKFLTEAEKTEVLQENTSVTAFFRQDILTKALAHAREYRSFYLAYFEQNPNTGGVSSFGTVWERTFVPLFTEMKVTNDRHMHYYFGFFQAGFMTTIRTWLQDGCPDTPEELSEIIFRMVQAEQFAGNKK